MSKATAAAQNMKHPLYVVDLTGSFYSQHVEIGQLCCTDGQPLLDRQMWDAGELAVKRLKRENIDASDAVEFRLWMDSANKMLKEQFFPYLVEMHGTGQLEVSNGSFADLAAAWEQYDWVEKLMFLLDALDKRSLSLAGAAEYPDALEIIVAIALLWRLDSAALCERLASGGLVEAVLDIASLRDRLVMPQTTKYAVERAKASVRKDSAKAGAAARLANDPKQLDKASVRECWELWNNDPSRYPSKASFGRDMLEKFPRLVSQKVIERWCSEWAKGTEQAR